MTSIEVVVGELGTTLVAYATGTNDKHAPMRWALGSEEPSNTEYTKLAVLYSTYEALALISDSTRARSAIIDRSKGDSLIHILRVTEDEWDDYLDKALELKKDLGNESI